MYAITASITVLVNTPTQFAVTSSRQIPTFYLDETVQGITSEDHAARIARTILDPWGLTPERDIVITATRI
jgi:hypothetical protein